MRIKFTLAMLFAVTQPPTTINYFINGYYYRGNLAGMPPITIRQNCKS